MKNIQHLIALPCIFLTLLSCGIYTVSPSALGNVKTIAIPLFDNQSTESGLREQLSDRLSQAFVTDNTLKVVPEQQADGILRGSVISYSREPYTYSKSEVVSEYKSVIGVKVEFVNRRSQKVIWEEANMSNWGTYDAVSETENDGKSRAIDKLVEDILNKTVKGW
ncbi:MAG TPA: hypothetical protein DEO84_10130 [candidate division Zixibacteria bacterium]|nr:hypothetical protein [candidate division Zixibacteria bacterium]HBZ01663.1 hypothetical protein [candidate division Zixibacteria bacterium]